MQKATSALGWELAQIPLGWAIFRHGEKVAHTYTGLGKEEGASVAQQVVSASDPQAALDEALQNRSIHLF
jgi:hypothetical protein